MKDEGHVGGQKVLHIHTVCAVLPAAADVNTDGVGHDVCSVLHTHLQRSRDLRRVLHHCNTFFWN